jgi:uncharacterized protein (AIM24 family)
MAEDKSVDGAIILASLFRRNRLQSRINHVIKLMMDINSQSTRNPPTKRLQPGLYYSISGIENQSLQLILERNKQVLVNASAVIWLSDKLSIKSKASFLSRILQPMHQILEISNETSQAAVIGLSQYSHHHGPICTIKSDNLPSACKLYCNRNNFLSATISVSIESKAILIRQHQPHLASIFIPGNNFYHCQFAPNDLSGAIFLQSSGLILEKVFEYGDCFLININNIVAFQESISITAATSGLASSSSSLSLLSSHMVKVEGLGVLYYTAFNDLPNSIGMGASRKTDQYMTSMAMIYLMIAVITLCLFSIMISKLAIEIEFPDNNQNQP